MPSSTASQDFSASPTAEEWFASATRVPLVMPGAEKQVINISAHFFARGNPAATSLSSSSLPLRSPSSPVITFIHGFPTSSHDFASLLPALAPMATLLLWDMWGYGDSDKEPLGKDQRDDGGGGQNIAREEFSVFTQADLLEVLWSHFGIGETHIVCHDLGDTVVQELAARGRARQLGSEQGAETKRTVIRDVFMFNGGIFPRLHRPVLLQNLLLVPAIAPFFCRYLMNEWTFNKGIRGVFSPTHPPSAVLLHDMWTGVLRREGYRHYHLLIRYLVERQRHQTRWEEGLDWLVRGGEGGKGRVHFEWGSRDPVSGAHLALELRRRYLDLGLRLLEEEEEGEREGKGRAMARVTLREKELGHWPFLEDAPGARGALRAFFQGEG
ncbi:hypothetical protein NSK_003981 [Nannochloropsis salina CCMP1776]|uniref:AB hydrolase-1 domain-containing protein n=1 Tax=Nannochloropsis salina CCMP1776 TaxID=1027361 RepID=A0A4D9D4K5_9STRA|nr:hypothetical protein NSK_003981 [Nannochloropsis salina CCMP1776]|eukprot:TFJ84953.1 hypothetical protein NSK_003981 [Nannochloropsis salina CCMP1776]